MKDVLMNNEYYMMKQKASTNEQKEISSIIIHGHACREDLSCMPLFIFCGGFHLRLESHSYIYVLELRQNRCHCCYHASLKVDAARGLNAMRW